MRKYHPPLPFSPSSNKHWIASKILCALQTCPDCNLLFSTSEDLSRNTDTGPLQQSTFSDTTQKSSLVGQAQVRCIEKMDLQARSGNQTHRSSQTTGNKRADFFFKLLFLPVTAAQGCSVSILQECDEIFNHETEMMKTMDGSLYYCSALPEEEKRK